MNQEQTRQRQISQDLLRQAHIDGDWYGEMGYRWTPTPGNDEKLQNWLTGCKQCLEIPTEKAVCGGYCLRRKKRGLK